MRRRCLNLYIVCSVSMYVLPTQCMVDVGLQLPCLCSQCVRVHVSLAFLFLSVIYECCVSLSLYSFSCLLCECVRTFAEFKLGCRAKTYIKVFCSLSLSLTHTLLSSVFALVCECSSFTSSLASSLFPARRVFCSLFSHLLKPWANYTVSTHTDTQGTFSRLHEHTTSS